MKKRVWFKAACVRALKTMAQAAIATIGSSAAMGQVNWALVGSSSALSGVLSVLTSLAGLPEVDGKGTKTWFTAACVRALKTMAQAAIATIGSSAAMGQVNWALVGSSSALSGVLSVLTSLAGLPEVEESAKGQLE